MTLSVSVCSDVVNSNPYQSCYHSSTRSTSLKQLELENMCISLQQQVDVCHRLKLVFSCVGIIVQLKCEDMQ